ncbi:putative Centromere kinetochore component CENP-T-domain-containing protein [Seiridium cardinale]|uniref:Centromere kinetochore component CENP-T-domain-containing protein n=1 Tax=Seiridium cardinale TaxID=138064 RepID=A0ABR2XN19_9PEZI
MASNNPSTANQNRLAPPSTPGAVTPSRRAASADPASGRQSASARRPAATPHARAAIRARDQRRRTIFTPGRTRRRSLRDQRETPRDILRNLSRVLAPASQPVHSSSSSSPGRDVSTTTLTPVAEDDDDDDFPIERPRFSLPLQENDDEDDSDLKAPRLSGLEDDNYTATSIELPRRAWSEGPSRLGRESLGSVRFSDYAGPDLRSDDIGIDSGFFPPPAMEDDSGNVMLDEAGVLERIDAEDLRRQTLGRASLFGPIEIPEGVDETTFMMAPVESPVRDPTVLEEVAGDEAPDMIDDDDDDVNEPMDYPEPGDYEDIPEENNDIEPQDETIVSAVPAQASKRGGRTKAGKQISKHGIEYPSLPQGVVKRLATTFARTSGSGKAKISADTMKTIMQATDWFFEQLGDDLSAYAKHAGRKTIDESDMITLMRRQRQIGASATPFSLAQRYLPRELLQELRMPVPPPTKALRHKAHDVHDDEDEDNT